MILRARRDKRALQLFERLSDRIISDFKKDGKGSVTAKASSHGEVYGLLAMCVRVEGHIPVATLRSAFSEGVKALLDRRLDLSEFTEVANRALRRPRGQRQTKFAMWSDLNLYWKQGLKPFSIKIDEAVVYCGSRLPRELARMPEETFRKNAVFDRNETRAFIWGYSQGRGDYEAGSKIERAFSVLQALVNMQSYLTGKVNIFPTDYRPTNHFDHGPNYYIFDRDGRRWSDIYWIADANFEKLWRDKKQSAAPIVSALPAIRNHRDGLNRSPFKDRLTDCLLNLNASWKAMTKSRRAAFLWMAFESLYSDKSQHCDQDTIIRRATFGLDGTTKKDWIYRLRFIAEMRNSEVHNFGHLSDTDPAHIILQFTNLFAVDCYRELLNMNTSSIKNDAEFLMLMELPFDHAEIARRQRVLRYAKTYLK